MKKSHDINLHSKEKLRNKGKKLSSQTWLRRQLNDVYVKAAHKDGYYARSAYKLVEINEKYKILKTGNTVIDIGAAPGGWSQVVSKAIFPKNTKVRDSEESANIKKPQLISIDLLPIKPIAGAQLITGDFTDITILQNIEELLCGNKVDVVLSDMSPNTSGSKSLDHDRIVYLVELAYDFAKKVLKENGTFVAKVFQGGAENEILHDIKQHFAIVNHYKPPASRKESKEIYLVAQKFRTK